MALPSISLIIPTFERQEHLVRLIGALKEQTLDAFEVVVVDQSATPLSFPPDAAGLNATLRYIHTLPPGLPRARNIGAEAASGEVLVFIDDDVELTATFLEAHALPYAEAGVGAIAGRITGGYDDGPEAPRKIGSFNRVLATVTRNFCALTPRENIAQLPGGNFSVRRELYLTLGGFDVSGFGGRSSIGEETDFAARLRAHGARIDFNPYAHLVHLHLPTGGCRDASKVEWTWWHAHNLCLLHRRHGFAAARPLFLLLQFGRYAVHGIKAGSPRVWWAGLRGTWAALRGAVAFQRQSPR